MLRRILWNGDVKGVFEADEEEELGWGEAEGLGM